MRRPVCAHDRGDSRGRSLDDRASKDPPLVSSYWIPGEGVLIDPLVPRSRESSGSPIRHDAVGDPAQQPPPLSRVGALCGEIQMQGFSATRLACTSSSTARKCRASRSAMFCREVSSRRRSARYARMTRPCTSRRPERWCSRMRSCAAAPRAEGPLGFVPDSLMDDPPQTRRGHTALVRAPARGARLRQSAARPRGPRRRRRARAAPRISSAAADAPHSRCRAPPVRVFVTGASGFIGGVLSASFCGDTTRSARWSAGPARSRPARSPSSGTSATARAWRELLAAGATGLRHPSCRGDRLPASERALTRSTLMGRGI